MKERGNLFLRRADFYAGIPLSWAAAAVRRLEKFFLVPGQMAKTAIFCPGAIGDLLLLSGLVNGMRPHVGHLEIISSTANAQACSLLGGIDSCRSFSITKPHAIIAYMRRQKYDLLIDSSQWARVGGIVSSLSGAALTVGFKRRGQHRAAGYDFVAEHSPARHEVENFLALGRKIWPSLTGRPSLKTQWTGGSKTVFLHMWPAAGRGASLKTWPEQYWRQLADHLMREGFEIRLTGAAADAAASELFKRKFFHDNPNIRSIAGVVNLEELAAMFAAGAAVVSVNTGIMHLAALLDAPTVGLHGATNPARWGGTGGRCLNLLPHSGVCAYLDLGFEYPPNVANSMINLPVEDVLQALRSLAVL